MTEAYNNDGNFWYNGDGLLQGSLPAINPENWISRHYKADDDISVQEVDGIQDGFDFTDLNSKRAAVAGSPMEGHCIYKQMPLPTAAPTALPSPEPTPKPTKTGFVATPQPTVAPVSVSMFSGMRFRGFTAQDFLASPTAQDAFIKTIKSELPSSFESKEAAVTILDAEDIDDSSSRRGLLAADSNIDVSYQVDIVLTALTGADDIDTIILAAKTDFVDDMTTALNDGSFATALSTAWASVVDIVEPTVDVAASVASADATVFNYIVLTSAPTVAPERDDDDDGGGGSKKSSSDSTTIIIIVVCVVVAVAAIGATMAFMMSKQGGGGSNAKVTAEAAF